MIVSQQQEIIYHDANYLRPLAGYLTPENIGSLVSNIQFIMLGSQVEISSSCVNSDISIYYFKNRAKEIDLANFEIFSDIELPRCTADAEAYQKRSPNQFTHVHAAVMTGSLITLKKLLRAGYCDVNAVNAHNETAFDMAAISGNKEMALLLMSQASAVFDFSLAFKSPMFGDYDDVQDYLEKVSNERKIDCCAAAIRARKTEFVVKFIKLYPEIINLPSPDGVLLLYAAMCTRCPQVVPLLLQAGASVTAASNANVLQKRESALEYSIRVPNLYQDIILNCVTPDTLDENGMSIIHYAAKYKNLEVLKYALAHQHNMGLLTRDGKSALICALEYQDRGSKINFSPCMAILLQAANETQLLPFLDPHLSPKILYDMLDTIKWNADNPTHQSVLLYLLFCAIYPSNPLFFSKVAELCSTETLNQPFQQTSILRIAVNRDRADMVRILIDHGVQVDPDLLTAKVSDEIKALLAPKSFQPKMF